MGDFSYCKLIEILLQLHGNEYYYKLDLDRWKRKRIGNGFGNFLKDKVVGGMVVAGEMKIDDRLDIEIDLRGVKYEW